MDIKLTDEQVQLQNGAQRFMDRECTMEFVRQMEASELGFSRAMWKQMAEMGWLGIDRPSDGGGLGMGTLDLTILMRELGRHICPTPFLSTAVIAGDAIARAGTDEQRRRHIEQIVAGELIVAFAYQEFSRSFDPSAVTVQALAADGHYVLNGTKMFVEYAAAADLLLVVARTSPQTSAPSRNGLTMFLVDAKADGISCTRTPTMARDHHYEVTFNGVRVPRERVLGRVDDAWADLEPVLHKAALAFSAFTNGACFELHERSTQFAKERVQFGRPIGQLQTIQGYLAQLIMEILGADMLTMFTAFNMDRGRHVRGYVAKAKAFSAETVARTMDIGSQIFGGMGYMEEVDTTLYLRRGKQYELMLGGTDYWYDVAAEEMIDVEEPVRLA
jgi:alkylation response protein AidB-like acyl-CoA dehydrogenase